MGVPVAELDDDTLADAVGVMVTLPVVELDTDTVTVPVEEVV